MAFYDWKKQPLAEPMTRVIEVTLGSGNKRYVVEQYRGTLHANWRSEQRWAELGRRWWRKEKAEVYAKKLDERMRKSAVVSREECTPTGEA